MRRERDTASMLIEHIFLGFCGLAAGLAVSAGTFAFLIVIGVIPRMIGKCNRAAETMHFENAVILGGICGNLASVFFTDPDTAWTAASVCIRHLRGNFCGKHCGGACGDLEYVSDHIPAHGSKGRTLLGHARDGGGKSGGIAVLFPWKF